jgi:DNA-binding beta-propeller fold protein YncE
LSFLKVRDSVLDVADGEVEGNPQRLERGLSGVAVGAGAVRVGLPRSREVLRIDGDTGRVEDRFEVHMRPGAMVFGGDRIWVADLDGGGVSVIDAGAARILKRGIVPRQEGLRLAVGAGNVWVSSAPTGTVSRIGLETALAGPPVPAGRGPAGVTVGGGLVWVRGARKGRCQCAGRTRWRQAMVAGRHRIGTW